MRRWMPALASCLLLPIGAVASDVPKLSERTADALLHVLAHEMGHAMMREFDLPILGPEEAIADDFATVYVHLTFPERAEAIVAARADQNIADGQEAGAFSEYRDDRQRAGRSVCLLYGLDPERHEGLAVRFEMGDEEAATCRDLAPEVGRSWRRIIDEYQMPPDARVTEVFIPDPDTPLARALARNGFADAAYDLLSGIDWHSGITLALEDCDGTSSWSRNGRRITICEAYVERFERQLGGP